MSSTEDRLTALEARVAQLEENAVDAELDRFRGRLGDMKVQASLAKMDAQDDVKVVLQRLDGVFSDAKHQLDKLRAESTSAGKSLSESVKSAVSDLRSGFEDATAPLRSRSKS